MTMEQKKMTGVSPEDTLSAALDHLLETYRRYYNINRENPPVPFAAEAVFRTHDEQYFLFKAAKMTDYDSSEYIYFALEESLTAKRLRELDEIAWREGISHARPGSQHRSTDVGLCILTMHADPEVKAAAVKLKHIKSYRFGLHGYSQYRLAVYDLTGNTIMRNRMGETLEKAIAHKFNLLKR